MLSHIRLHLRVRASLQLRWHPFQLILVGAIVDPTSILQNESQDQTEYRKIKKQNHTSSVSGWGNFNVSLLLSGPARSGCFISCATSSRLVLYVGGSAPSGGTPLDPCLLSQRVQRPGHSASSRADTEGLRTTEGTEGLFESSSQLHLRRS